MKNKEKILSILKDYTILTLATVILNIGTYVFKFPNNFSFGGVTGISVILSKVFNHSASTYNFIINIALLVFGFIFLGKAFGIKTVYVSMLSSIGLSFMDKFFPLSAPLTNQPVLELIFAIVLPATSSAILFNLAASSGGTDIIALIIKKYKNINIGLALFIVDLFVTISACFVFDAQTGLFSLCGLLAKSLVIDGVMENMNLCKYFTIVCDNPKPICDYINNELNRSSTIFKAEGSYTHNDKTIIFTVMKRRQAIQIRNFIKKNQPLAFMMITNSSEIIGNGFTGFN